MMENAEVADKNQMRIQSLAMRERIQPAVAEAAAQAIAAYLLEVIPLEANIVAGYRPIRSELDITEAMKQLAARGHMLCLPGIETADKPLYFRRWRIAEALEKGRFGIEVPPAHAPVFRPDAVIAPVVAFDRAGQRLGYGAGYYDRTITHLRESGRNIPFIGVAYSMQRVERIPEEPHDVKLDVVVTEKGIWQCT